MRLSLTRAEATAGTQFSTGLRGGFDAAVRRGLDWKNCYSRQRNCAICKGPLILLGAQAVDRMQLAVIHMSSIYNFIGINKIIRKNIYNIYICLIAGEAANVQVGEGRGTRAVRHAGKGSQWVSCFVTSGTIPAVVMALVKSQLGPANALRTKFECQDFLAQETVLEALASGLTSEAPSFNDSSSKRSSADALPQLPDRCEKRC